MSRQSSKAEKEKREFTQMNFLDSGLVPNDSFIMDFMFDVSVPPVNSSLKMLNMEVPIDAYIEPLITADFGDFAPCPLLMGLDGPFIDLINCNTYTSSDDILLDDVEREVVNDLDVDGKKAKRHETDLIALRAPTYVAVEFTAQELAEKAEAFRALTGRREVEEENVSPILGTAKSPNRLPEEYFNIPLSSLVHPLKPTVVAEESWDLLPDDELWGRYLMPFSFETDPLVESHIKADVRTDKSMYLRTQRVPALQGQRSAIVTGDPNAGLVFQLYVDNNIHPDNQKLDIQTVIENQEACENASLNVKLRSYQGSAANNAGTDEQTLLITLPNKNAVAAAVKFAILQPRVNLSKASPQAQLITRDAPDVLAVTHREFTQNEKQRLDARKKVISSDVASQGAVPTILHNSSAAADITALLGVSNGLFTNNGTMMTSFDDSDESD